MRRKVAAHGLSITPGSRGDDESFKFNDPDGFVVQINGLNHRALSIAWIVIERTRAVV